MTGSAAEHPFPEDPQAEVCAITGGPASARLYESPREIRGWYGSTVADMTVIAVLDDTMPVGPICDDEISKALAEGRVAHTYPVTEDEIAAMPDAALRGLLVLGVETVERLVADPESAGRLPLGYQTDQDDALVHRFMPALTGTGDEPAGRTDIAGLGQLMALVARARGNPLVPGAVRDAAVAEAVAGFRAAREWRQDLVSSLA